MLKKYRKRVFTAFLELVLMLALLTGIFPAQVQAEPENNLDIHCLYLGEEVRGDCTLLVSNGEFLLMDLGAEGHAPEIIGLLQQYGAQEVSVYLTHMHGDHTGRYGSDCAYTIRAITEAGIRIKNLYEADPAILHYEEDTPLNYLRNYEQFAAFMEEGKLNGTVTGDVIDLNVGDGFLFGSTSVDIIGPLPLSKTPEDYKEEVKDNIYKDENRSMYSYYENNLSLAAVFTCGSTRFFAAGDLLVDGELLLVEQYGDSLQCDIMKFNHHGFLSANCEELIDAIKPRYSFGSNLGDLKWGMNGTWQTHLAQKVASKYGISCSVSNEETDVVYQIRNDVITMCFGRDPQPVGAGWLFVKGADGINRQTDAYYIKNNNGTVPLTGVQKIDGKYYYLGTGGCMEYGNYQGSKYMYWKGEESARRYFFLSDDGLAYMACNGVCRLDDGTLRVFDKNGYRLHPASKKVMTVGGADYLVGTSGTVAVKAWGTVGSTKYYAGSNGKLVKNKKLKIGKSVYLFDAKGRLIRNTKKKALFTFQGKQYVVGTSGAVVVNALSTIGSYKYYSGSSGVIVKNALKKSGGKYFYFNSKGRAVKNQRVKIKGKYYYFGANGVRYAKRYVKYKGVKYYCGSNGVMKKVKK